MPRRYRQRNDDAQTYRRPSVSSLSLAGPQRGSSLVWSSGGTLAPTLGPGRCRDNEIPPTEIIKWGRIGPLIQARNPMQGMRPLLSGLDAAKMFQVGQCLTQFSNGSGGHSLY